MGIGMPPVVMQNFLVISAFFLEITFNTERLILVKTSNNFLLFVMYSFLGVHVLIVLDIEVVQSLIAPHSALKLQLLMHVLVAHFFSPFSL